MLTRPAPERPLRQVFLTTGLSFILGLIVGQFLPQKWSFDQLPIRIDFPFRVAAIGAFGSFVSMGMMQLTQVWRKRFLITVLILIPILLPTAAAMLYPVFSGPMIDIDALRRILPIAWTVLIAAIAVIVLGAGAGWFRWLKAVSRSGRDL